MEDQIEIDNDISIINQYHHLISHQPARVSPFQGSSSDGSVGPVTRQARRRQPSPHNSNRHVCVCVPVTPCYCRYVSNSYSHPPVPCANGKKFWVCFRRGHSNTKVRNTEPRQFFRFAVFVASLGRKNSLYVWLTFGIHQHDTRTTATAMMMIIRMP